MSDRLGERPPAFSDGEVIDLREKLQAQLDYLDRVLGNAPPLPAPRVFNPADWEGRQAPQRRWIVRDYIPERAVTLLYADGGTGKSYLKLQLAVARALAKEWIGLMPEPGRTLVCSSEDDADEMWRRIGGMLPFYGARMADLGDIRLIDLAGESSVLGLLARGIIEPTPMYAAIEKLVVEFKPGLVELDVLADMFSGSENDRSQVTQFVGLLKRLCRAYDCGVLLLAQPSVSGMNTDSGTSGSTGWGNSGRSRLWFKRVKDNEGNELNRDLRTFEGRKNNYGEIGGKFEVEWKNGLFCRRNGASGFDKMASDQKADDVFLKLLRQLTRQNIPVRATTSRSGAPVLFAARTCENQGLKAKDFEAAMHRLLAAGTIRNELETKGPPSRREYRLVSQC